jgi:catechol 2,3-dioxygenase-like lactoylglutathione lyase family enzyme
MSGQKNGAFQLPEVVYDGSSILVSRDNHTSVIEWFEKYAGWKRTGQEFKDSSYINTELGPFGVWINCDDNIVLPEVKDTNVRFCFKTRDLEKFHSILSENGVKVSNMYQGPLNHGYFDFWIPFEGIRLTAEGDPNNKYEELSDDWVRAGVKDIQKAKEWYNRYIGMSVISEHPEEGYVVMGMRANFQTDETQHPFWVLEQLTEGTSTTNRDERARPYTFVDQSAFLDYHQFLSEQDMFVSEVEGNLKYLTMFHIYDPDGNRFNIRTFSM